MSNLKQRFEEGFTCTLFQYRSIWLVLIAGFTGFFAYQVTFLQVDTNLKKMVPLQHEFIVNLFKHKDEMSLGNELKIAVAVKEGDILTKDYMETLRQISDEVFYLPGVDKSNVKSLWTPNVRWSEVTEDGFRGGGIIPNGYDGSASTLEAVRTNILRSGQVGRLVADDFKSTIVQLPLLDEAALSEPLNYKELSLILEEKIRSQYASETISIHIVGFAKKMGDLMEAAAKIVLFFLLALLVTAALLFYYSRCMRCSALVITCSLIAVVWQLGVLSWLGRGIDPYSMLVPFLVFAIGVSHGVQIINAVAEQSSLGHEKKQATMFAFKSIYVPGLLALASDGMGFLTLYLIDIGVIKELAAAASIGVAIVILTNLILLPLLLSIIGHNQQFRERVERGNENPGVLWRFIAKFAQPKYARAVILVSFVGGAAGLYISQDLQIGDLDAGAPELRPDSRYNIDDGFINQNYSVSADVLVIMVESEPQGCSKYATVAAMDRLQWQLDQVEGVQSSVSLVNVSKYVLSAFSEANLKWAAIPRQPERLNLSLQGVPDGLMNLDCDLAPIVVFLTDHKAATLNRVVASVKEFADGNNTDSLKFLLASGNAGVEAATNDVIGSAQIKMLALVYAVVSVLCLLTFRSFKAVFCIITPLILTSVLCQALMTVMGIGVKVATLPVIALGVGIGVDYGIYIFHRLTQELGQGKELPAAYLNSLIVSGKAVGFTGVTLAIGVGTWIFSDIKFQADMGVLLTFMFVWNMIGALCLMPALATFVYGDRGQTA